MKIILVDTRARFRDDVRNRLLIDDERTVELLTDLGAVTGLETAINRYKPDAVVIADNVYSGDTVVDVFGVATVGYITKPVNPDVFTPNGILTFGFIENATHLLNLLEVGLPAPKETEPQNYPSTPQNVYDNRDSGKGMPTYQPQPSQNLNQTSGGQPTYPNRPITNNRPVDDDSYLPNFSNQQYGQPQGQEPHNHGANQYGQPQYGQSQYGQPQSAQPQYGQSQYGQSQYNQSQPIPQYGQTQHNQAQPDQQPNYNQPYNAPQNREGMYQGTIPAYPNVQQYGAQGAEKPVQHSSPQNNPQPQYYGNSQQMSAYGHPQTDIKSQMDADRGHRIAASGERSMMEDLAVKNAKTKTVAIYAAKGGVGKTTIATELSVLLALMTQGRSTMRVCLIDFNIDFGDVLTTLNLDVKGPCLTHWAREIRRRINNGEKPEDINYSTRDIEGHLQKYKNTSLFVLVAPIAHEDSMEIESAELEVIMRNIRENGLFDFVICDTGNNTRDSTVIALEAADQVLLVATQDVSAVNCDNRFLQTMSRIGFDTSKIRLVINSIMPYKYTQVSTKEVEDRFRYPCIARFKRDPEVTKANNCSTPLVEQPNHEFTKEMRNIVAHITGRPIAVHEKKSGFFSKFKKKG